MITYIRKLVKFEMTLVDLKLTTCRSVTDTNTHCKTTFFWTLLFILKESIGRSQYSYSSLRYSKTFHLRYFTQSLLIDDKRVLLLKEKKERKRKLVNIYLFFHYFHWPLCCVMQVDIFQMYILEFKDRPGEPLYHLEHFIEGEYIKYNSNSGFVDENLRYTPQVSFNDVIIIIYVCRYIFIIKDKTGKYCWLMTYHYW